MKSPTNLLRIALISLFLLVACEPEEHNYIYQKLIARVYTTNGYTVQNGAKFKQDDVFFTAIIPVTRLASNFKWGSSAYATSVPEPTTKLAEKIADIKVVALNDFSDTYKAGDNIADVCTYYDTENSHVTDDRYIAFVDSTARTKQAAIDAINSSFVGFYSYNNLVQRFAFRIKAKAYTNTAQRFAIVLITDKYTALTDTTVTINIKP